jgi:hypothetical protein
MIKQWATRAIDVGSGLIASLLMRSAIKPLLELDEKSLLEVGLSHDDLIECLATPFTTDPARFLAARCRRRNQRIKPKPLDRHARPRAASIRCARR